MPAALASLLPAAISGIAGAFGENKNEQTTLQPNTSLENQLFGQLGSGYSDLSNLTAAGPGLGAITQSNNANNDLAQMLQQYSQSGGLPNQQQIGAANQFAAQMFAPQKLGLQQDFLNSQQNMRQTAAALGRPITDPILNSKLQVGYNNSLQSLAAQQGAYASNFALQLPQQQLGYAQQRSQLLQGLASQALQNRSSLLGMGTQMLAPQLQMQSWTASRNTNTGSPFGAIAGFFGGLDTGLSNFGKVQASGNSSPGIFSGLGFGMQQQPQAQPARPAFDSSKQSIFDYVSQYGQ